MNNELVWRKASESTANGACFEVAASAGEPVAVRVRDSKDPDGPTLGLGRDEWMALLTYTKSGGIDDMVTDI